MRKGGLLKEMQFFNDKLRDLQKLKDATEVAALMKDLEWAWRHDNKLTKRYIKV